MPKFDLSMLLLGCAGGIIPDVLRIIQDRHSLTIPAYLKSGVFWISLLLLAGLGGLTAWLFDAKDVKQALAFGFGAPEIISRVFGKIAGGVDRGIDRGDEQGATSTLSFSEWWGS